MFCFLAGMAVGAYIISRFSSDTEELGNDVKDSVKHFRDRRASRKNKQKD